jgi:hypothetical protein
MSWPLRFRNDPEPWKNARFGDCWYMPDWFREGHPYDAIRQMFLNHQASRQYLEQHSDRAPVVIFLPPGLAFSPDEKYRGGHRGDNPEREGWTVTGSPEDGSLVVSPSINIMDVYHGWVQNGQVSDDVEGRLFLQAEAPPSH